MALLSSLSKLPCLLSLLVCLSSGARISSQSSNLYTVLGGNFTIECETDEIEIFDWYHNGVKLDSPYPTGITVDPARDIGTEKSVLRKVDVVEADKGTYSCHADGSAEVTVKFLTIRAEDAVVEKQDASAWLYCADPDVAQGSLSYTVQWSKDGLEISDVGNYAIDPENGTLEIKKVDYEKDLGVYQCELLDPAGNRIGVEQVNLTSVPKVLKFDSQSKNIKKGGQLTLKCAVDGYPPPTLSWQRDDEVLTSDNTGNRLKISDDGTELTIEDLDYSDRGVYYCIGDSGNGRVSNSSIMVRVKDPLAALWPFIGIVLELALLGVIIFFYERQKARRKAQEEAEEKGEGQDETRGLTGDSSRSSAHGENIELRKRNT